LQNSLHATTELVIYYRCLIVVSIERMIPFGKVDGRCAVGDVPAAECLEQMLVLACWQSASQLLQKYVEVSESFRRCLGLQNVFLLARCILEVLAAVTHNAVSKSEAELVSNKLFAPSECDCASRQKVALDTLK